MSVSLGLGFFSSRAVADMICPDWQYPHCTTARSPHAFCTAFAARDDRPSIVVTWRLATAETGAEQERNVCPSTWTVRAPHCAMPHPYLVPVRPTSSRMTHSSGVSGSPSNSRRVPLMLSVMDMQSSSYRGRMPGGWRSSGRGAGGSGLDPRSDQGAQLRLRAGRGLAVSAGHPAPAHQRVVRRVLVDRRERLAAVALQVLYLLAGLPQRFRLPCHRLRRDMPQGMSGNARRLVVCILMEGRAAHADGPFVVGTTDHQRRMRMTVIALRRPLTNRVAIQAAWMLEDPTRLDEQR